MSLRTMYSAKSTANFSALSFNKFLYKYGGSMVLMTVGTLLCFAPLMQHERWYTGGDRSVNDIPLYYGVSDPDFKMSAAVSIAISVPILVEFILYCRRTNIIPQALILLCFLLLLPMIPLIFLQAIIFPQHNYSSVPSILETRNVLVIGCSFTFFSRYGKQYLDLKLIHLNTALYLISFILGSQTAYISRSQQDVYGLISLTLLGISFLFFILLSLWTLYKMKQKQRKRKEFTNDDKICMIHIIGFFCLNFAVMINMFLHDHHGRWLDRGKAYIINHTYLITAYISILATINGQYLYESSFTVQADIEKKIKRSIIGYFSHELRTPLNSAMLGLQILKRDLETVLHTETASKYAETVKEIESSCSRVVDILKDLVTFEELEVGEVQLDSTVIRIKPLLDDKLEVFRAQAWNKEIQFMVRYNTAPQIQRAVVKGDEEKLQQIIRNLLTNALESAGEKGKVDVKIDIHRGQMVDDTLVIQIRDSGSFISKTNNLSVMSGDKAKFTADVIEPGKVGGLELLIARRLVEMHRGTMTFESTSSTEVTNTHQSLPANVDNWNIFTITLPVKLDATVSRRERDSSGESRAMGYLSHQVSAFEEKLDGKAPLTAKNKKPAHPVQALPNRVISTKFVRVPSEVIDHSPMPSHSQRPSKILAITPDPVAMLGRDDVMPFAPLEANPETATTTTVTIPKQTPVNITIFAPTPAVISDAQSTEMRKVKRVLVVDDAMMNRKMLCRLMEGHCEKTDVADNGSSAVGCIRNAMDEGRVYDLVLMDYQMPHMDGPTAAKKMRQMGFTGVIIGVTGNVQTSQIDNYIAHGANRVLQKPLNFESLKQTIEDLGMGLTLDDK